MTLLEVTGSLAVLAILFGSIVAATLGTQDVFVEDQVISQLHLRTEEALDRLVALTSLSLTSDAFFFPLLPSTGVGSHCLRFRRAQGIDAATGNVIFDDAAKVYLLGPDNGAFPCRGLIVGRGPDLNTVSTVGQGPDGYLGTVDDAVNTIISGNVPVVELLLPDSFAPRTGQMFTIDLSPAPVGRMVTFTLRVNTRGADGSFVLNNDLVFTERVALWQ